MKSGASLSLKPSPIRFSPITIKDKIAPGMIQIQGEKPKKETPPLIILPKVGVGG